MTTYRQKWSRTPAAGRSASMRDDGVITIQLSVIMPVVLLMLFAATQVALLYHGRTTAIAAAQEGARAGAAQSATAADAEVAAAAFVAAVGGDGVLPGAQVTATRSATTATVVVTGTTLSLVPGWTPQISGTASAPVEQVTSG